MLLISFLCALQAIHMRERDQTMTTLLEHFDFYVMPVMNVDGYEYTWSHPSVRRAFLTGCAMYWCAIYGNYQCACLGHHFHPGTAHPKLLICAWNFCISALQTTKNAATNWHLTHSTFVSSKLLEMHLEMTEFHLGILILPGVRERLCQPSAARLQIAAQSSTSWIACCITQSTASNSLLPPAR